MRFRFDQAAISLNHAVLLQPQNPFILLQHAELEFTRGEFETGLKEFLRVIEMSIELEKGKGGGLMGCGRRAALGARMVSNTHTLSLVFFKEGKC